MHSRTTLAYVVGLAIPLLTGRTAGAQTVLAQLPPDKAPGAIESPAHSGAWILGGTGFLGVNPAPINASSLILSPEALVFVYPRLAVGAKGSLDLTSGNNSHGTTLGFGPTARFFIDDLSDRVLAFISATVLPEWAHQYQNGSVSYDESVLTLDGSFGATYLLASHVGLTGEAFASRSESSITNQGASRSSSGSSAYGLRFGFTVFVH